MEKKAHTSFVADVGARRLPQVVAITGCVWPLIVARLISQVVSGCGCCCCCCCDIEAIGEGWKKEKTILLIEDLSNGLAANK